MTDAYCGPSNALQSFQKHTSVDRTLQQDRLTGRGAPAESFRSPQPNAGLLDPEFEAFQASQPGPLPFADPSFPQFQQSHNQRGKQPIFANNLGASNWATDFQRLQVSSPMPQQHVPFSSMQSAAPPVQAPSANAASRQPIFNQTSFGHTYQPRFGGLGGYGQGYMQPTGQVQLQESQPMQADQADAFDEAAFERAFDAAKEQILAEEVVPTPVGNISTAPKDQDPYLYLSILRFSLASALFDPTEEHMHRAALYFALAEEHINRAPANPQVQLFAPIMQYLGGFANLPYSRRYHLPERARQLQERLDAVKPEEESSWTASQFSGGLHNMYSSFWPPSLGNWSAVPNTSSARDEEMREDVKMQLGGLRGQELAEKVFKIIPQETADSVVQSLEQDYPQQALRAEIMRNPALAHLAKRKTFDAEAFHDLYLQTREAAFEPEAVELRDSQAANDRYVAGQPLDMESPMLETQPDNQQAQQPSLPDENDELARTAGELLTKVSDNKSLKFQNSTFLDLMRRLRDREVKVEGDKMVESTESPSGRLDNAAPDYVPPQPLNQVRSVPPSSSLPASQPLTSSNDIRDQEMRDGEDVVQFLNQPQPRGGNASNGLEDFYHPSHGGDFGAYVGDRAGGNVDGSEMLQDSDYLMTSPFYDNEHAELGRRGLYFE